LLFQLDCPFLLLFPHNPPVFPGLSNTVQFLEGFPGALPLAMIQTRDTLAYELLEGTGEIGRLEVVLKT
jgi:hypothetical protein